MKEWTERVTRQSRQSRQSRIKDRRPKGVLPKKHEAAMKQTSIGFQLG
jgi:hypothetical protein